MRRVLGAMLAATVLAGCAARPPAAQPAPVRVLVYNMHAGKDAGGADNLARVAALAQGADLVLLQEVDRGTRRSGKVDQLAELARRTGFHGAFGKTLDYQGGEYGIGVLSRWPIRSDTLIRLRVDPPQERAGGAYEPRGMLHVGVDAPQGPIEVLNTHLDAAGDDRYRRQEVATVIAHAARLRAENPFVIVGGDFNAEPGSAVIARMAENGWTDAWAECGGEDGRTYPSDTPTKRIDYLFLSPALRCETVQVIATEASDHRPLRVRLSPARGWR